MRRAFSRGQTFALCLGLVLALTLPGCARLAHHRRKCCPTGGETIQYPLPETERGSLAPDLRHVGTLAEVTAILGTRSGHAYRALTPRECQCLAAEASTLGNLFEADRRSVLTTASQKHKGPTKAERLKAEILAIAALEARNRSAADALDMYYRIAEAETQQDILNISLFEMNSAVEKIDRMRRQGMQITFDDTELFNKRHELRGKQVDLEGAIARLNIELRRQLGFMVEDDTWRIWPVTDLCVTVERLDAEEEVATGMQLRPEIALLMHLQNAQDPETIDVTRQALGSLAGVSGASGSSSHCKLLTQIKLKKEAKQKSAELGQRQQQLNDYSQSRIQHISAEIRQSVVTLELRLKQIALAKEHEAYAAEQVRELEGRNTAGKSNFLELTLARLQQKQAQSDEVSRVISWKVADVRLRENQGKLIDECCGGYSPETDMHDHPHATFPPAEMIQEEPVPPPAVRPNQPKELPVPPTSIENPAPEETIPDGVIPDEPSAEEPALLPAVENTATLVLPESFEPQVVRTRSTRADSEIRRTSSER